MQTPFDERRNNFDSSRILLAELVLFSHSYALATGSDAGDPVNLLTRAQQAGGPSRKTPLCLSPHLQRTFPIHKYQGT